MTIFYTVEQYCLGFAFAAQLYCCYLLRQYFAFHVCAYISVYTAAAIRTLGCRRDLTEEVTETERGKKRWIVDKLFGRREINTLIFKNKLYRRI